MLRENCETASSSPSVNVDWCYFGVNACKFASKRLLRITILIGGSYRGSRKNMTSVAETKED